MKATAPRRRTGSVDGFGRVVIPKPLRNKWGLKKGAKVLFEEEHDGLKILSPVDPCRLVSEGGFLVADVRPAEDVDSGNVLGRVRGDRSARIRRGGKP